MSRKFCHSITARVALVFGLMSMTMGVSGQSGTGNGVPAHSTKNGEWPTYAGDVKGTRYSPLSQINADNFNRLEIAWRFKTDNLGTRPEFKLEGTPLMVNGVVYATGGTRRSVAALDAGTGELLWVHGEREGQRGVAAPRQLSGRGLAYWTDGIEERILYVTPGYRLIALNAKTGVTGPTFGKNGAVDLKLDIDQNIDLVTGEIGLQSAPVVARDVVIIGAAFREGMTPRTHKNNKGYIRGYDVRSGKRLWIFHTIPMPGEFGNETWLNNSWSENGNTGVWTQISVDEELGLVREPGKPVWPLEERPVEMGDVHGEWYSPTQPYPSWPPAYARQGVSTRDQIAFPTGLRAQAVQAEAKFKVGRSFTPPVVSKG